MKFAIIADIHANLEAFQVVLEDIKQQKCTHHACLGDVVGYNANPKECLDIVRTMAMPCVKGNHDEYCSSEEALDGFNPHAAEARANHAVPITYTFRLPKRSPSDPPISRNAASVSV